MNKREYFLRALRANAFLHKDWVLGCFAVTLTEDSEDWTRWPYPYRIVFKENEAYFIDPEKSGDLTRLEGVVEGEPFFSMSESTVLNPGDLVNVKEKVKTNYGNVLFNAVVLIWPFGDKFPFMTGRVSGKDLDRLVTENLTDTPPVGSSRDPKKVYVDELLKYCDAITSLGGYTQLCVPAASPKSLTVDPAVLAERDRLLEKHKDQLNDPAVLADIEKRLVEMDKKSFVGDEAEGFLISKKSFGVVRKKLYIMHGAETGFGENVSDMAVIPTSLAEGWNIDELPAMADSLRFGSYNRGAQTALGGESVKYFHRVFQNTKIAEEDCGSKLGWDWVVTEDNCKDLDGLYSATQMGKDGKSFQYTEEWLKQNVGKTINVRSPMLCKTEGTSFCVKCMGERLALNPQGLIIATADVGSRFMSIFMAAMHGKALQTNPYDFREQIT